VVREMTEKMKEIGRDRIIAENEKLYPYLERMLARKRQRQMPRKSVTA